MGFAKVFPLSRVLQQNGILSSQGNASAPTIEQPHAKVALQRFDLESNGRLGKKKLLSRFVKVQVLGDGAQAARCTDPLPLVQKRESQALGPGFQNFDPFFLV